MTWLWGGVLLAVVGLALAVAGFRRRRIARLHAMIATYRGLAACAISRDDLLVIYRRYCWAVAEGALMFDETARHAEAVRSYMLARLAAPVFRVTHSL